MTIAPALLALLLAPPASTTPAPGKDAAAPYAQWFAKNTMVTDKKTYVHVFWNAQDARAAFGASDKKELAAKAAWELARTEIPEKAAADLVKVDVVFVKERDNYGLPKWDTLERVAHVELLRSKLPAAAGADGAHLVALCEKLQVY
jgi:hypothetical protein